MDGRTGPVFFSQYTQVLNHVIYLQLICQLDLKGIAFETPQNEEKIRHMTENGQSSRQPNNHEFKPKCIKLGQVMQSFWAPV